jgi:hypothetical protein
MYKLNQKNDVERHIQILNNKSDTPLEIKAIEKYWKDQSLFECSVTATVKGSTKEECIYNTLMKVQCISTTWEINGPFQNGINSFFFEGVFNENTENKPLKWAHFTLELSGL